MGVNNKGGERNTFGALIYYLTDTLPLFSSAKEIIIDNYSEIELRSFNNNFIYVLASSQEEANTFFSEGKYIKVLSQEKEKIPCAGITGNIYIGLVNELGRILDDFSAVSFLSDSSADAIAVVDSGFPVKNGAVRTLSISKTAGSGSVNVVSSSELAVIQASGVTSIFIITYDYTENTSFSFIENGEDSIKFSFDFESSDLFTNFDIKVTDLDGTDSTFSAESSANSDLGLTGSQASQTNVDFYVPFSSFSTLVNFAEIVELEITITNSAGKDMNINSIFLAKLNSASVDNDLSIKCISCK